MATLKRFNESTGNWEYIQLAGEDISKIKDDIGDLELLETEEKEDLVGAVNENRDELVAHKEESAADNVHNAGLPDGLATLDSTGNVPESQLGNAATEIKVDNRTVFINEDDELTTDDPELTFYNRGFENEGVTGGWIEGHSQGSGSVTKTPAFLLLEAGWVSETTSRRTLGTNNKINLSSINNLKVELDKNRVSGEGSVSFQLRVVENDINDESDYITRYLSTDPSSGLIIRNLDVSSITGEYYISVMTTAAGTSGEPVSELKVYRVWGEE